MLNDTVYEWNADTAKAISHKFGYVIDATRAVVVGVYVC
jgi:hypothetical protein